VHLNAHGGLNRLILGGGGIDVLFVNNFIVAPVTDNFSPLGAPFQRWTALYAVNGTIQTSDARLKKNIISLNYGLESILKLQPVSFTWKDDAGDSKHFGLIAQDVITVIKEIVDTGTDPDQPLGINYSELVPVLIKGMQEQQSQIESQQKEIDELKALVNSLIASQPLKGNN
jgi:hypothetical protein